MITFLLRFFLFNLNWVLFRSAKIFVYFEAGNLLIPKSDQHLISPYNITPESHFEVMRIKEMITNKGSSWLLNNYWRTVWRIYILIFRCKGLKKKLKGGAIHIWSKWPIGRELTRKLLKCILRDIKDWISKLSISFTASWFHYWSAVSFPFISFLLSGYPGSCPLLLRLP